MRVGDAASQIRCAFQVLLHGDCSCATLRREIRRLGRKRTRQPVRFACIQGQQKTAAMEKISSHPIGHAKTGRSIKAEIDPPQVSLWKGSLVHLRETQASKSKAGPNGDYGSKCSRNRTGITQAAVTE